MAAPPPPKRMRKMKSNGAPGARLAELRRLLVRLLVSLRHALARLPAAAATGARAAQMKRTHWPRRAGTRAARYYVVICLWGATQDTRMFAASFCAGALCARCRAAQCRAYASRARPAPAFSCPLSVLSRRIQLVNNTHGVTEARAWVCAAARWRCAARHAKQLWRPPERQRSQQLSARLGRGPGVDMH